MSKNRILIVTGLLLIVLISTIICVFRASSGKSETGASDKRSFLESKQKHNNTSDGTFSATDSGENWTPNDIQTTEKNGLEDVETIGLLTPDSVKTNSTKGDSASLESDIEVQEKKTEYNSSSEYAFESSDDSPVFNSDFESYISTPEEESSEANENIDDWEGPPAESF